MQETSTCGADCHLSASGSFSISTRVADAPLRVRRPLVQSASPRLLCLTVMPWW
jgi:hypothetical protein